MADEPRVDPIPRAWMRRWAYDGIDVMKLPMDQRPRHWSYKDVTTTKIFDDDEPLFAMTKEKS